MYQADSSGKLLVNKNSTQGDVYDLSRFLSRRFEVGLSFTGVGGHQPCFKPCEPLTHSKVRQGKSSSTAVCVCVCATVRVRGAPPRVKRDSQTSFLNRGIMTPDAFKVLHEAAAVRAPSTSMRALPKPPTLFDDVVQQSNRSPSSLPSSASFPCPPLSFSVQNAFLPSPILSSSFTFPSHLTSS